MEQGKRKIHCTTCGSLMKFHPRKQQLVCEHCESTIDIISKKSKVKKHWIETEKERVSILISKGKKMVTCEGCGASIEGENSDITLICPYCGSYYISDLEEENRIIPDGILPFYIDDIRLKELFRKWIKNRYFAPSKLKNLYQQSKFQGKYMPYWIFDTNAMAQYRGYGGRTRIEHYKDKDGKTHTRTKTDWYPVSGTVYHEFTDVTISASKERAIYAEDILPFAVSSAKPYQEEYLYGFLANHYDVLMKDAYCTAKHYMENKLKTDAKNDVLKIYDSEKNIKIQSYFSEEQYRYILLPVYITSYYFQKKEYIVLINGQTGNIYGEYPKSIWKILCVILIIGFIIFLVYLYSK